MFILTRVVVLRSWSWSRGASRTSFCGLSLGLGPPGLGLGLVPPGLGLGLGATWSQDQDQDLFFVRQKL